MLSLKWLKNGIPLKKVYRFFIPSDTDEEDPKLFGQSGEKTAVSFLKKNRLKILETNYKSRYGEIDIIAMDGETIVFVEVKARRSIKFGSPLEAVDHKKQRKISVTALDYLRNNRKSDVPARFDVIAILTINKKTKIEHVKNAFELRYR